MWAKKLIKAIFRNLGFEIHRYTANASPTAQIVSALDHFKIDLILDIGANQGQFASEIRTGGFLGEIVSFEPLTAAHLALVAATNNDAKWRAHPRCALGDHDGEIEINIAGNSVSSSILPMLESHKMAAPLSAYQGREVTDIRKLDTVAKEYLEAGHHIFLKVDTQGFEWQVLNGARETLQNAQGILLELTLSPLYEGQHLWRDTIDRLEAEGFTLWALLPGFTDSVNGRTFQIDGIFFKRP